MPSEPSSPGAWRLIELARLGGVTSQQIRNYLEMGVLPPAARRSNGYRTFTEQHADALLATRAIVAGHGWHRTRQIMSAVHRHNLSAALAAVDDGHAELAAERAHVARVAEAFATAADDPEPVTRRMATIGELAADIGVRTPVLRLWERRGLLAPDRDRATGYRTFDAAEQRTAHLVAVLRRGGYGMPVVTAVIATLRATGDTGRARAELARRDDDLRGLSLRRLQGSAALLAYIDKHVAGP